MNAWPQERCADFEFIFISLFLFVSVLCITNEHLYLDCLSIVKIGLSLPIEIQVGPRHNNKTRTYRYPPEHAQTLTGKTQID
jgi:hypothetical protein